MSTIQPVYKTMKALLSNRRFNIDEYQREYKWEQKQLEELLTDLTQRFSDYYKPGDDTLKVKNYDDYFLGPIIIASRDGENFIVDGQQRCTTITLLLIYLYHKCVEQDLSQKTLIEPLIFSDNYGEKVLIAVPDKVAIVIRIQF